LGKSQLQKQQEKLNFQLSQAQADQARQSSINQQAFLAQVQKISGQISPFAESAIQAGIDAVAGRANPALVNAYLQPARSALTAGYTQGRQNLIEALGAQGIYGSGLGIGPLASLESSQARDIGNLTQQANIQALQTGLGLGFQGANILQGQQGIFNPIPFGQLSQGFAQTAMVDPRQYARAGGGLLGSVVGAGLGAVGSIYQGQG